MHPKQLERIQKRRAQKRAARPSASFAPRAGRPPTALELAQLDARLALEKQRELDRVNQVQLDALFECAMREMDRIGAWHWLWRAARVIQAQKRRGYSHQHPTNDNGGYVRTATLLRLPKLPPMQLLFDDKVAVVVKRVKSLPQKGNVPILKPEGFREVDPDHAPEFWLHSKGFAFPKTQAMIDWADAVIERVASNELPGNVRWMERLYGAPDNTLAVTTGITPGPSIPLSKTRRLESAGRARVSSVPARFGARMKRCAPEVRARIQHELDMEQRSRIRGPFYQDRKLINRDVAYETYRRNR